MAAPANTYRVGLILAAELSVPDYPLSIGNQKCNVSFDSTGNPRKYCDLVITDKEPSTLISIPDQQKYCHETVLVLNKFSNPPLEKQYEAIFTKAVSLRYKLINPLTKESITNLINVQLVKYLVKEGRLDSISLLFNKYTRRDLLNRIRDLGWLLVPFILIILYLVAKYIGSKSGYSLSFLCLVVEYEPDCKTNIFGELKLLALVYSVFNLKFYYDYILSIFDNINNDIFQFNTGRTFIHKQLQFFTPIILFASAFIIFKALFIFKYSFRIAEENSFINIGSILDRRLPFLKDDYLIYYFLLLDGCLWIMTRNLFKIIDVASIPFLSNRQKNLIKEAQKSFRISIVWDIIILTGTVALFNSIISDQQSKLAIQLILLQSVYLYINISTIFYDFRYK